jgi:sulfide:quinone oxidoreductase
VIIGEKILLEAFLDETTSTFSYLLLDRSTLQCALIDSVLGFDPKSGHTDTDAADRLIARVLELGASVEWILETHVHADHLSAATYLKQQLGGKVAIGCHIKKVQEVFGELFNAGESFKRDGSQFDVLLAEGEAFRIGTLGAKALHTPGHTPACMTYFVQTEGHSVAFVGDTLFMPDYGTARCDFPGGDARTLFRSIKKILELPADTQIFMCHDYCPNGRPVAFMSTVADQRLNNIHVREGICEDDFVMMRENRDATLDMPTLILQSVQVNMRSGHLPEPESNGIQYLKIPLNTIARPGVSQPHIGHEAQPMTAPATHHQVVIIGGGSAGIAAASSLKARDRSLDIAIIDPADVHYYQPGWTLVGGGVFTAKSTVRAMASVIPNDVQWIKAAVVTLRPETNTIVLDNAASIGYDQLIVCPGLKLDWAAIHGLTDTLGAHGVTSNYRYDLAPYTWQLVQNLKHGQALFTQPPMPIKCAGAPQKALYLSCDYWLKNGRQSTIKTSFYTAGAVLFGVADYVPALMQYMHKYAVDLKFTYTLVAVDGPKQQATFECTLPDGTLDRVVESFDLLHVVPPQVAPDFIRNSPLADKAGWVDVDPGSLVHRRYANVHGLGDVINTTNAKTVAAARKQAPVVANNVLVALGHNRDWAAYNGYGSCPLTVERGKVVLAEFTYGGKVEPTFAPWLIDGRKPSRLAWILKKHVLPLLYWQGMLKGREWLAGPSKVAAGQDK